MCFGDTQRILHAQSYIYHKAYTLLLSQALNTLSVDYETLKRKENPTATVEGQGVAIYREVTTTQLHLFFPAATANKLDKTTRRRKTNFFIGTRTQNDSQVPSQNSNLFRRHSGSLFCSSVPPRWWASEKSAGNWAVLSEYMSGKSGRNYRQQRIELERRNQTVARAGSALKQGKI